MNNLDTEIERKYLVKYIPENYDGCYEVFAGYFKNSDGLSIRVVATEDKIKNTKSGRITFKSPGTLLRKEYEFRIDYQKAIDMLENLTCGKIIKTRYDYKMSDYILELDQYHGDNDGLVVAEIELSSIDQKVNLHDCIGEEVTEDQKYYNANLAFHPFCDW